MKNLKNGWDNFRKDFIKNWKKYITNTIIFTIFYLIILIIISFSTLITSQGGSSFWIYFLSSLTLPFFSLISILKIILVCLLFSLLITYFFKQLQKEKMISIFKVFKIGILIGAIIGFILYFFSLIDPFGIFSIWHDFSKEVFFLFLMGIVTYTFFGAFLLTIVYKYKKLLNNQKDKNKKLIKYLLFGSSIGVILGIIFYLIILGLKSEDNWFYLSLGIPFIIGKNLLSMGFIFGGITIYTLLGGIISLIIYIIKNYKLMFNK